MTAVPAQLAFDFVVQDNRGFRARVRFNTFDADVSIDAGTAASWFAIAAGIGTALGNMTNAKVVSSGFGWRFDLAQEPSSETGTYQLVQDKAILNFGDGNTLKEHVFIPAPKDALFLTSSQDNLIVVDRSSSQLAALQAAFTGTTSPTGGIPLSQFFGGQYKGSKSRRRRVLQGA